MHYLIFLKGNPRLQMEISHWWGQFKKTKQMLPVARLANFSLVTHLQWNLDLTKCQLGTGEICSFYRGFVKTTWTIIVYILYK